MLKKIILPQFKPENVVHIKLSGIVTKTTIDGQTFLYCFATVYLEIISPFLISLLTVKDYHYCLLITGPRLTSGRIYVVLYV